jgi:PIN domain nuclease of toxin-antitoxin system
LEIAIKATRGRDDFHIDAGLFRRRLFDNGYAELSITGRTRACLACARIHRPDPFDCMPVARATIEGPTLVTTDPAVTKYAGPIRLV